MPFDEGLYKNPANIYLQKPGKNIIFLYFLVLLIFLSVLFSLPFLYIDISVVAPGVVRPALERTEIKSVVAGLIDSIYFKEGSLVEKDSTILSLNRDNIIIRLNLVSSELKKINQSVKDLQLLTSGVVNRECLKNIQTPVYRKKFTSFLDKQKTHFLLINKQEEEFSISKYLAAEKVISQKEFFDKTNSLQLVRSDFRVFSNEAISGWQDELSNILSTQARVLAERNELELQAKNTMQRSPVAGVVLYAMARYKGNYLQAGETIAVLSPETTLIAECLLPAKDAGIVRSDQKVVFRVDAFNYSYFGLLTGKVLSIDNDYTVMANKPFFKIRCSFDKDTISLKNGFSTSLKKGLTLQASFVLTKRSLWQLLFDRLDDWLNPKNQSLK